MNDIVINPCIQRLLKSGARTTGVQNFYNVNLDSVSRILKNKSSEFWQKEGEKMAMRLFKAASGKVPAYKAFLKKNGIKPSLIKSKKDFEQVPFIDKENYLRKYPLEEMCWNGKIESNTLLSVSSGSSLSAKISQMSTGSMSGP